MVWVIVVSNIREQKVVQLRNMRVQYGQSVICEHCCLLDLRNTVLESLSDDDGEARRGRRLVKH